MPLNAALIKKLVGPHEPSAMIDMRYKGLDVSFKTDQQGYPVLLFIGERDAQGIVKGQRYVRTLKFDPQGHKIKDHWELKGRAS